MKKYFLQVQVYILFSLLFISCSGQVNTNSATDILDQSKSISAAHPKLVKTQGSGESDNVWCALQDKSGNIWFGTTGEGVYRYDGKLFTQFTVKDGLSNNCVYSILEDIFGNIWFGTLDGICRYDARQSSTVELSKEAGRIIPVPIPVFIESTKNNNNYYSSKSTKNTVWSMLQDKSGKIWFGTGDGVYCYNGFTFTRFLQNDGVINKDSLKLKMVDCILEDKSGNIWFASGCPPGMEGVCCYDGKSITSFKPNGDSWIRYIKEDKKGNLWFGGRLHGNFIYDGKTFMNFVEKVGIGNSILVDKSGNIWFSGEEKQSSVESVEGIWCYDGKNFKNFGTKEGLGKYFVWNMFEDRNGNIWIGTRNTGLYKYDGKTFTNFAE